MSRSRTLRTYEGEAVTVTFDAALCIHAEACVRGGTANPPFCDGTHTRVGFAPCDPSPASGSGTAAPA